MNDFILGLCCMLFGAFIGMLAMNGHGQDTHRNKVIAGCIKANETMSHATVIPYCTDMIDRWSGLSK